MLFIFSHNWFGKLFSFLFLLSFGIVIVLGSLSVVQAELTQSHTFSNIQSQIAPLQSEKRSRSVAQRKIDYQLLYELKKHRGEAIAHGVPTPETGIEIDQDGRVLVDIQARVTDGLLEKIERSGGKIINSFAEYNAIRALIPLTQVEVLASLDDIRFIRPAVKPRTSGGAISP